LTRMLFHCTHGGDDPERAIVPFIAASVAAASGQEAVVLLTIEGAWLCKRGYAETVSADGFPDLAELVTSFVAQIVGAATIVAAVADGAIPVALG
jgi:predicted peroxiredoxin